MQGSLTPKPPTDFLSKCSESWCWDHLCNPGAEQVPRASPEITVGTVYSIWGHSGLLFSYFIYLFKDFY